MRYLLLALQPGHTNWRITAQSDHKIELETLQDGLKQEVKSYLVDTWDA